MHVYDCMLFVNFYLHVTTCIAMVVCCLSAFIYMYVPLCMFMCIVCQHHVNILGYMHILCKHAQESLSRSTHTYL